MAQNQYSFSEVRGQHGNNATIKRSAWVNIEETVRPMKNDGKYYFFQKNKDAYYFLNQIDLLIPLVWNVRYKTVHSHLEVAARHWMMCLINI